MRNRDRVRIGGRGRVRIGIKGGIENSGDGDDDDGGTTSLAEKLTKQVQVEARTRGGQSPRTKTKEAGEAER